LLAFAADALELGEFIEQSSATPLTVEENGMPEPTRPPAIPRTTSGSRTKTTFHVNPNAATHAKIIAAGTRDDHPAVVAGQAAAAKRSKGVADAR
jgi:hypothetical protein